MIVSETPGTTRDAIDTVFQRGDRTFVLVDTAGLRRKRRHRQGIEYYSELRALEAAERADVALVLIDTSRGHRRARPHRRRRRAQGAVLDARRPVQVGPRRRRDRGRRGPSSSGGCASVRRTWPCRRRPAAGSSACSTRSSGSSRSTPRRVPTAELNRFLARAARARGSRRRKNGKRLNLLYGTQVDDAAAALPASRQRPAPRHARLRLLGREPAPRALRARGRARHDRLREARRERRRRRRRVVGDGVRPSAPPIAATTSRSPRAIRSRRARSRETGRNPRYLRDADLSGSRRRPSTQRRSRTPSSIVLAVPEPRLRATSPRRCPATAPVLSLTKGLDPATGERLSTRVDEPAGRGAVRPEHGRRGRRRPAVRDGDRERGQRPRRAAPARRSTRSSSASTSTTTSSGSSSAPRRRT